MLNLLVYSKTGMAVVSDLSGDMPVSERIPSVLMEPHLGKGHVLYMANFCNSSSLTVYFIENQTHLCGIVFPNWQFYSKELTSIELQKSEAAF